MNIKVMKYGNGVLLALLITGNLIYAAHQGSSSIQNFSELNDTSKVNSLNKFAYQNLNSSPLKCITLAQQAESLAITLNYNTGLARSYSVQGGYYWSISNYNEALRKFLLSLEIYKSLEDKLGLAKTHNNIAEIYIKQGNYKEALRYHLLALSFFKESNSRDYELSYHNIGELYFKLGEFDKAIEFQSVALELSTSHNNIKVQAYSHFGLANVYSKFDEIALAKKNYNQAILQGLQVNDFRIVSNAYSKLGELFIDINNYDSALFYLARSDDYATPISALDLLLDNQSSYSKLYSQQEDYNRAYIHQVQYNALKDSIFNIEKLDEMAHLQANYELNAQKNEEEFLKKQNELNEWQLKELRITIIGGAIAFVLLIIIFYTIIQQAKRRAKDHELLMLENAEIEQKKREEETLSRSISNLNLKLTTTNSTLTEEVKKRTEQLEKQNHILAEHANINLYKLREPLSAIMESIKAIDDNEDTVARKKVIQQLKLATLELDKVVIGIRNTLEQNDL